MGLFSGISKIFSKVGGAIAPLAPWAGPIGAVAGGLLSNYGASQQNKASSAQALRSMQFSGDQAAIQREFTSAQSLRQMNFQRKMSNTAHRREVRDLKLAGLNPILSGTGGMGAASPGGASGAGATGSGAQAQQVNTMDMAMNTALSLTRQMAEIRLINAKTGTILPAAEVGGTVSDVITSKLPNSAATVARIMSEAESDVQSFLNDQFRRRSQITPTPSSKYRYRQPFKKNTNPKYRTQ